VFDSHIEKRKDDLDEVIVVFDHYIFHVYTLYIPANIRKNAQIVTNLFTSCQQVVFTLLVPSLL
jgi:hypothetical protein